MDIPVSYAHGLVPVRKMQGLVVVGLSGDALGPSSVLFVSVPGSVPEVQNPDVLNAQAAAAGERAPVLLRYGRAKQIVREGK
jgi:hypothetical protein